MLCGRTQQAMSEPSGHSRGLFHTCTPVLEPPLEGRPFAGLSATMWSVVMRLVSVSELVGEPGTDLQFDSAVHALRTRGRLWLSWDHDDRWVDKLLARCADAGINATRTFDEDCGWLVYLPAVMGNDPWQWSRMQSPPKKPRWWRRR